MVPNKVCSGFCFYFSKKDFFVCICRFEKFSVIIYVKFITNKNMLIFIRGKKMKINYFSKIKSALFSTLIIVGFYFLMGLLDSHTIDINTLFILIIILFYAGIGNFIYGIPVSILSDYLSSKLLKYRFIVAVFIHIFFGCITTLIIGELGKFAIISSCLFFLCEEWQNRKVHKVGKIKITINTIILFSMLFISWWGSIQLLDLSEEKTNNIYLIPEGYEGSIITFYNVSNQPQLQMKEDFNLIPVQVKYLEALKDTYIYPYGITLTSTEDMTSGTVNDKYYYVDTKGKRTKVKESCVYHGSGGSFTVESDKEVNYNIIQITNSDCGEDFMFKGKDDYDIQA